MATPPIQDNKSMTGTARYASVAGSSSFELPSVSIFPREALAKKKDSSVYFGESEVRFSGQVEEDSHCPKHPKPLIHP